MAGKRTVDQGRVRALAGKGLTPQQIAARVGCSTRTVNRILKEGK